MAHFAVIGAGVIGVASAWQLCKLGHKVTLIERETAICAGASARNGAQLSYSYCDALASPSLLGRLPSILLGRDPAFRIRLQADPSFYAWGLRFLWNCRRRAFEDNTSSLLRLAAETQKRLPEVIRAFDLQFDHAASGKLVLCPTRADMEMAALGLAFKARHGLEQHLLSRDQAEAIEPALKRYQDDFAGAVYSPRDAAGRAPEFCSGLAAGLKRHYGLELITGRPARQIILRKGRVAGVALEGGSIACDAAVVATGSAQDLLPARWRRLGGLWPVQGYSITVQASPGAMQVSITDPRRRMVFARVGSDVRIAGIADIGNRICAFDQSRMDVLRQQAATAFSGCFDIGGPDAPWTGARPCAPSSRPWIGHTAVPGLFMNIGHGTLGWTLCLGSAVQLGAAVTQAFPQVFASVRNAA